MVEAFGFASESAAGNRSNSDRTLDSNTPSVDHTSNEVAVSLAVESLEGLHNDGEMEDCDH